MDIIQCLMPLSMKKIGGQRFVRKLFHVICVSTTEKSI